MWISRKRFEDMERRLSALERRVNSEPWVEWEVGSPMPYMTGARLKDAVAAAMNHLGIEIVRGLKYKVLKHK